VCGIGEASQRHGQLSIQLCLCMRVCARTCVHARLGVRACVRVYECVRVWCVVMHTEGYACVCACGAAVKSSRTNLARKVQKVSEKVCCLFSVMSRPRFLIGDAHPENHSPFADTNHVAPSESAMRCVYSVSTLNTVPG
jgi:hypothetical protein